MSSPASLQTSRIASAILRERDAARQELSAAWQLQVFRVEEALATGWEEHIGRVFEERFAELAERIEREIAPVVDTSGCTARLLDHVEQVLDASVQK